LGNCEIGSVGDISRICLGYRAVALWLRLKRLVGRLFRLPMEFWHGSCLHGVVPSRHSNRPPSAVATRSELEDALRRVSRTAQALREVGAALGPSEDLDDVLELVLDKTQELLESDRATLFLLDETTGDLVSRIVGGGQVRSVRLRVGYGIAGYVAQTGKTLRIPNAYADPRFEPEWDRLTGFVTRSMLATPLRNHLGATIGVLQVLNKRNATEFTTEDEELLIALSTQAAIAIDNSRLVLRLKEKNRQLLDTQLALERRVRDLQLMFELERATARPESLKALAEAVLSRVVVACGARAGAMLVAEEEGEQYLLFVSQESGPSIVAAERVKPSNGLLALVMRERIARHLGPAELSAQALEVDLDFEAHCAITAPLEGEDSAFGALALFDHRYPSAFGEDDVELVHLVAANVSTALRLYRAALARERSERLTAIGSLLSQVVHDFKTPMTVISGYAQLMVDADDRTQRADYAEEIIRQFEMVASMQREVLEFARGERNLFVRRIHLGRFFDELTRQIQRELEGTQIELRVEADRKAIVRFDEGRMTRVLHNLVRNAIEAMAEKGGVLSIVGRREADLLVFEVADTGPGIPKQIEQTLFQSFVSANKSGGTGLGLAIVKKTVEEHGGTVEADSSDKGARFRIRLPQRVDSVPMPPGSDPQHKSVAKRASTRPPPRSTA
jgi:signal transduction histidine kinase